MALGIIINTTAIYTLTQEEIMGIDELALFVCLYGIQARRREHHPRIRRVKAHGEDWFDSANAASSVLAALLLLSTYRPSSPSIYRPSFVLRYQGLYIPSMEPERYNFSPNLSSATFLREELGLFGTHITTPINGATLRAAPHL